LADGEVKRSLIAVLGDSTLVVLEDDSACVNDLSAPDCWMILRAEAISGGWGCC
jgi:hypothetical protein